jgi:hypothetical protein
MYTDKAAAPSFSSVNIRVHPWLMISFTAPTTLAD